MRRIRSEWIELRVSERRALTMLHYSFQLLERVISIFLKFAYQVRRELLRPKIVASCVIDSRWLSGQVVECSRTRPVAF